MLMRSAARMAVAAAAAAASGAIVALWRLGSPSLPPLDPQRWGPWWSAQPVIDSIAGMARALAIASAVTVLAVLVGASITVRSAPSRPPVWLRWLPPSVVSNLVAVVAAAVSPTPAGAVSDGGGTAPDVSDASVSTAQLSPQPGPQEAPVAAAPAPPDQSQAGAEPAAPGRTFLPWATPPPIGPSANPPADPPAHSPPPVHVVEPGEHLWSIAEAEMGRRLGRNPTEVETDPYWRKLMAANTDRLVDPDNPDLIYPGQELVLPS